jgi:hypothetical protein
LYKKKKQLKFSKKFGESKNGNKMAKLAIHLKSNKHLWWKEKIKLSEDFFSGDSNKL